MTTNQKGLFITFEGGDGCGKTTQLNLCAEYLQKKGFSVLVTREPGSQGLGEKLREVLLHYNGPVAPTCEAFLFLADRAQHINQIVKPALETGKIILCDRHTDSSIAYQGYGRGENIKQIELLNNIATQDIKPNLTLVFDVSEEIAQKRVGSQKDRMESAGKDFHKRVRNGYLEIAKQNPTRVKVVDANLPIEEVFKQVKKIIDNIIQG